MDKSSLTRDQDIRCPVCCEKFNGKDGTPEFQTFSQKHQICNGQKFNCECEWERLCDGTTLLCRVTEPCEPCVLLEQGDGCLRCPGCPECQV